ncbi:MAG: 4-(cytidine 5'-diphospho)-2-C-methyl-D-erythritol kinase [Candidatus Omnitrophica bacterium]|nr:4-(cytidine 5'-diphospho)-2-C-methyl-D-erythritol kinase [Candidatus Omnitrophota bacterium]
MQSLTLNSYAKLNLVLDVLGQRPDGFHELRTIFERIDLHDTIILKRTSGPIRIVCDHPHVPLGPRNLAYQVAQRLQKDFDIPEGVTITIEKRIPVTAGLAGGSSNAASVLQGLNRLWGLGLTSKKLRDYAWAVGSDVAFFLYDTSYALGEGRGEQIKVLAFKTKLWHVLVTPQVKIYTRDVFRRLNLKLTKKKDNVNILLPFLRGNNLYSIGSSLSNDLEPAILSLKPHWGRLLKEKLFDAGAVGVCFSGSGPSVFALAESQKHALSLRARFDRRFSQVFVVSTY